MGSRDYQIVFRGRLVPGQEPSQVKQNLARLFNIDVERVAPMFSGKRQVLKKGLDRETADKYRARLKKAGVIVSVVSEETMRSAHGNVPESERDVTIAKPGPDPATQKSSSETSESAQQGPQAPAPDTSGQGRAVFEARDPKSTPPPPARAVFTVDDPTAPETRLPEPHTAAPQDSDTAATGDDGMLAPAGEQIIEHEPIVSLEFDIEGLTMAQTGEVMDASPRPAAPDIDTSDLAASEDFEALDDARPPPPPDIDTHEMGVAAEDAAMDTSPPPPPAEIDISGLSATDEFESLDGQPPEQPPAIETSHLKVEDS